MPTYIGRCTDCGEFDEVMRATEYLSLGGLSCPFCKKKAETVIRSAPAFIGPRGSQALNIEQIGQTFNSPEEQKAYFAKRPDRALVSPTDTSFRNLRDDAYNQADKKAKAMGFRDHEDRKSFARKDNAQRKAIKNGDLKVQV
jgi:hypothetical protein|tara:strand:- start:2516 stop:2941 length:426 start_codon:yes stop_codon:yes gene_type:complete